MLPCMVACCCWLLNFEEMYLKLMRKLAKVPMLIQSFNSLYQLKSIFVHGKRHFVLSRLGEHCGTGE